MIRMSKRYYKVGEIIWDVKEKKPMRIHDIDLEKQEVIVADTKQSGFAKVCLTRKLWEIDKYRKKGDINLKNVNVGTKKDVNGETWKPISGFEELYEISDWGNVKSLGRVVRDSIGRVRNIKPKYLKKSLTSRRNEEDKGYLTVRLTGESDTGKNYVIHRLVAEAFIENKENKATVNHIDGDKHNNRKENLEWATYSENNFHAYDNDLKSDNRYVVRTDDNDKIVGIYKSMHEANRKTGIDYRRVHKLCNSYNGFDGEYYWSYIEDFEVTGNLLYFAKTSPDAKIPSREDGSAGYDFYTLIEPRETTEGVVYEQLLEKGKVNTVHTGIASAMSDKYFLSMSSERSSIGKLGINIFAGVIDSNYRGEIMLMITPLIKDILITSMTNEVVEEEDVILYPYSRAVAQSLLLPVPDVEVEELSYDELKNIASERGVGGWGSSNK